MCIRVHPWFIKDRPQDAHEPPHNEKPRHSAGVFNFRRRIVHHDRGPGVRFADTRALIIGGMAQAAFALVMSLTGLAPAAPRVSTRKKYTLPLSNPSNSRRFLPVTVCRRQLFSSSGSPSQM